MIEVKMSVGYMCFSAHSDAKGIMQLITQCEPKNVHGKTEEMVFLSAKIKQELHLDCYTPENGETATIPNKVSLPVDVSRKLFKFE